MDVALSHSLAGLLRDNALAIVAVAIAALYPMVRLLVRLNAYTFSAPVKAAIVFLGLGHIAVVVVFLVRLNNGDDNLIGTSTGLDAAEFTALNLYLIWAWLLPVCFIFGKKKGA